MQWHQLEYFRKLAEMEHMTKAAKALAISQPALSRSIAKLEDELGAPLFDRTGRSIKVNRYGLLFLKKVQTAMATILEGKQEIHDLVSPEHGQTAIGFLHTLGNELVPTLLATYKNEHPNIRFSLYQSYSEVLLDKLMKNDIDLCFISPTVHAPDIHYDQLFVEPLFICVPKGHPMASERDVSFSRLQNEAFVCMKKGYGLRLIFDEMCESVGFQPNIVFEGEEVATLAGLVSANLGIAILPHTKDIDSERMSLLKINDMACQRRIGLASRQSAYLSPAAAAFKTFIIDYFSRQK
ncbi:DNA-binding transcriptional LysR family regulator [Scopulibacillus darangshiensis]|uniref:DNA-binding transcriptional LysR family regulator n=1 Tax=Scopulibacillus darangshiensis TaxID=442528 RepID=A0A4R2P5P8_9BACL|nr:LysR family transcriptional regulator [Scopulibacillus darangshiensis]TCP30179.1 DNA-binding transcriptional LysR family regulator [Scopulibacillus darangshiensis]